MKSPDDANLSPVEPSDASTPYAWEACLSLVLALGLLLLTPRYVPVRLDVIVIPGFIAALGFALGISAFRHGRWYVKLVAACAICGHAVMIVATGYDLYLLG